MRRTFFMLCVIKLSSTTPLIFLIKLNKLSLAYHTVWCDVKRITPLGVISITYEERV